ncbi:phosphocholine-specific phospholipase C [Cupriavidus basilensis]|uniref:phosphocholine-specific phospholipase C n=1 Tax=Cupriavidus basilensis TaxID=68895 RepID=UPI0009E5649D|nr:phospholipase C, phosphocholine-specific [Cupriavidus basilensis]
MSSKSLKSRRQFLKFGAASAGAAAASMVLPQSIRDALAISANRRTGTLQDVEHIVVLMQENRSFDHYFGTMNGVRGFGDPKPVPLRSGRPVWYQPAGRNADARTGYANVGYANWPKTSQWYESDPVLQAQQKYVLPFRLDTTTTNAQHLGGTDHNWKLEQGIWKHWDAWVPLKSRMSMGYYDARKDLPFYYQLASAFTICDANHCSIFANTEPNRQYYTSGASVYTMSGYQAGTRKRLKGQELDNNWTANMDLDEAWEGLTWKCYAERLQEKKIDWRVYQAYSNYGCNSVAFHKTFRKLDKQSDEYRRGRAYVGNKLASNEAAYDEELANAIAQDVQNGTLPQVSWIICPDAYCEHPDASPAAGQALVDKLLKALTSNPEVWAKTVFIINYDENDGFFDHVPAYVPPVNTAMYGYQGQSTVSVDEENYNGVPIGLGPRVPMMVVSPWSKGGWVCSQVFDHTSVLRFIEARFGVPCEYISPWRRAVCGDLTSAFDFTKPNGDLPTDLPNTTYYKADADAARTRPSPAVPSAPTRPVQEVGQRRARALPYELFAHGRADADGKRFWIDFANTGAAGAGFIVYANGATSYAEPDKPHDQDDTVFPPATFDALNNGGGVWQYTVEAGKSLSDNWMPQPAGAQDGRYDLSVYGPNGFLNQFRGKLGQAGPEVAACYDITNGKLLLTLVNQGKQACVMYAANGYDSADARTYHLAPGVSQQDSWDLSATSQWFDVRLTTDAGDGFLRRFAGHIETGRHSLTDPRIGGAAVDML